MVTVGVLALQGDVREHARMLTGLGARVIPVRYAAELSLVDGLVLPGGESSVIDKMARAFGIADPLRQRIAEGMPVFGTCAGLILLAERIADGIPDQRTFGGLDVTVRRNAFGRQNESFETSLPIPALGEPAVTASFIRAPVVEEVGAADVLASLPDGRIVAVEQGAVLATAFHPEITGETRLHERFLSRVHESR